MLNDAWLCVEIINGMLHKRNKPTINHKRYQEDFDFPVKDLYRKLGFDFSAESFETLSAKFITEYNKRRFECKLQDSTISVLQSCADKGITQSILSAYQQAALEETVDSYRISPFFLRVVGLEDHFANSKIENGKRLIKELAFLPDEVLLVGDTTHDFEVARTIGADCVLIPSGYHQCEKLELCETSILDSLAQVLTLL